MPLWDGNEWDPVLADFLEEIFDRGHAVSTGVRVVAAIMWAFPHIGGPIKAKLPLCDVALRGWKALRPQLSRPPIPEAVAAAISLDLLKQGLPWSGLLVMVLFETYLRPSEALAMRVKQVVHPVAGGAGHLAYTALVVHPEELLVPGKTGVFDHTVVFDLARHQWLGTLLSKLAKALPGEVPLFPMCYEEFYRAFLKAVVRLHLQVLRPSPYGLHLTHTNHDP